MSSNNVFKANFIQFTPENTKVIDANSLVAKRLEGFSGVYRETAKETNEKEPLDEEQGGVIASLLADRDAEEGFDESGFSEGFVEGLPVAEAEVPVLTDEEALAEIDEMRNRALQEIENLKEQVLGEARQEGFEQGYAEGMKQAEEQYNAMLSELETERAKMNGEFEDLVKNLEPKMVEVITGVYKKVFGDGFFNKREVLVNLIHKAIFAAGSDEDLVIHVSSEDYDTVMDAKDEIFGKMNFKREPEIRAEERLSSGEAKVENFHGIIDCGIDTELEELTRMLKVLSYEGNE